METFQYFWSNHCDENIERIPVAAKNIDHVFNMASEIMIGFICFCFLTALELMIMNT